MTKENKSKDTNKEDLKFEDIVLGSRLRLGLSRQEAADRVGISKDQLQRIELGWVQLPDIGDNTREALKDLALEAVEKNKHERLIAEAKKETKKKNKFKHKNNKK